MSLLSQHYKERPEFWPNGLSVGHFGKDNIFLVKEANTGEAIGWVGWQELQEDGKKVGYYSVGINADKRGRGFGEAAVRSLIEKKSSGVDEVKALVVDGNEPSLGLARKLNIPVEVKANPATVSKTARWMPRMVPLRKNLLQDIIIRGISAAAAGGSTYVNMEDKTKDETSRRVTAGIAALLGGGLQRSYGNPLLMGLSTAPTLAIVGANSVGNALHATAEKTNETADKVGKISDKSLEIINNIESFVKEKGPAVLAAAGALGTLAVGSQIYAARKRQDLAEKLMALDKTLNPEEDESSKEQIMNKEAGGGAAAARFFASLIPAVAANSYIIGGDLFDQAPKSQRQLDRGAPFLNFGGALMGAAIAARKPFRGGNRILNNLFSTTAGTAIGTAPTFLTSLLNANVNTPIERALEKAQPNLDKLQGVVDNLDSTGKNLKDFWDNMNLASKIGVVASAPLAIGLTVANSVSQDKAVTDLVNYITERERKRLGNTELPEERAVRKMKELAEADIPGTEGMPAPWRESLDKAANTSKRANAKAALILGGAVLGAAVRGENAEFPNVMDGLQEGELKNMGGELGRMAVSIASGIGLMAGPKRAKPLALAGLIGEPFIMGGTRLVNRLADKVEQGAFDLGKAPVVGGAPAPHPASGQDGASKWLIGGGLGLGALALAAAAMANKKSQPEPTAPAPANIDLSGLDLSTLDLEKLKPYSGPRIKVTLPTRHEGDAETQIDIPAPSMSDIYMSQDMQRGLKRDIRRRLIAESRSRVRSRGEDLDELAGLG